MEHLVVMGVTGTGKSTVAEALQRQLGWPFAEGDDFHPPENVAKMAAGVPLGDADREPWLDAIADWTRGQGGRPTIVTCSALKRSYRDRLRAVPGRTVFVLLAGPPELLTERLAGRKGHFMPASLLASQLDTLEPLGDDEDGFVVDVSQEPSAVVGEILTRLGRGSAAS